MIKILSWIIILLIGIVAVGVIIEFIKDYIRSKKIYHSNEEDKSQFYIEWKYEHSNNKKISTYRIGDKLYCFVGGKIWMLATPTEPCKLQYWGHVLFRQAFDNDELVEVDLYKEKWIHPHINKEVKKYFPNL